ncbi:eCIS core domain-containing protein [Actinophytocola sp. KF-1]
MATPATAPTSPTSAPTNPPTATHPLSAPPTTSPNTDTTTPKLAPTSPSPRATPPTTTTSPATPPTATPHPTANAHLPEPATRTQLAPLDGNALDGNALDSPVPQAVVVPLRRALGVDVSTVPVRRGGLVAQAARRLRARAFTTDGVVHIPDHAGALDSGTTAPLLAHELTHAVQQQLFGAALPSSGSALGRRLESDAVAVEHWVRGGAAGSPPPVVRQLAPEQPDDDEPEGWHDLPVMDTSALFDEATPLPLDAEDVEPPDVSTTGLIAAYRDLRAGEQNGDTATSAEELVDLIADNPPRRWLDLDDPDNFDEIANRLYHHLVGRLRFDVLVERERSGTLLDFS